MIPDESKKPNKQINNALFLISETALKYSVLPTNFNPFTNLNPFLSNITK
jgi:hypothetical protein